MPDKELLELLNQMDIVSKAYEQIRLVDPINRKVLNYKKAADAGSQTSCFDFWKRSRVCDNCISMRAFNENQTFVKVEYVKRPESRRVLTGWEMEYENKG